MANGKKVQPWYPANDVEAEKAARGDAYQGVDGNFYQHEDMPKASAKNPPEAVADAAAGMTAQSTVDNVAPELTAPGAPEGSAAITDVDPVSKIVTLEPHLQATADDLDVIAAEEAAKLATSAPPSLDNTTSHRKATPGGPTNPSYDADEMDSTGENAKTDGIPGPRGADRPADVMSDDERAQIALKHDEKLRKGMSPTHSIDSTGKPKGEFEIQQMGHDKHGARIPDRVLYDEPVEKHATMVGPRGAGAPKDSFHKK